MWGTKNLATMGGTGNGNRSTTLKVKADCDVSCDHYTIGVTPQGNRSRTIGKLRHLDRPFGRCFSTPGKKNEHQKSS